MRSTVARAAAMAFLVSLSGQASGQTAAPGTSSGNMTNISCGSIVTGDTTGASDDIGAPGGEHYYYSVTVTEPMRYTFSTCEGSSYDTRLRLYSGSHLEASGIELANVDDACDLQSVIELDLEPGSYTLIVEGFNTNEGVHMVTTSCGEHNGMTQAAACSAHSDCDEATYCNSLASCYECGHCVNIDNDAIDGTCPDHCNAFAETTFDLKQAFAGQAGAAGSDSKDNLDGADRKTLIIIAAVAAAMLVVAAVAMRNPGSKDEQEDLPRHDEELPAYESSPSLTPVEDGADDMTPSRHIKAKTLARAENAPGQRELSFDQPTMPIPMHGMAEFHAISEL